MKLTIKSRQQPTVIYPELVEIYQPVLGFEPVSVWINIYHNLINDLPVTETELIQQMNISLRSLREALGALKRYHLVQSGGEDEYMLQFPLPAPEIARAVESGRFPAETNRRMLTLIESFQLKRGQAFQGEEPKPAASSAATGLSEQQVDELTTRFINECRFIPNKQLRERFDLWFEQIQDPRLLEELLERTRKKVELEGTRGSCPSNYADKIVRQWLIQGINTYEDLIRKDKEFKKRWEYYRVVEKELGREFNSLTPAEKELVDNWLTKVKDPQELKKLLGSLILSGEYKGRGTPGLVFIDQWLNNHGKKPTNTKSGFTHEHKPSDLQQAIKRKTLIGLEDVGDER
ncbi:MAG: hypothetical protein FH749_09425 [Firmicutes bacterium]|nr:hypothetical protein [Bacillota bacterium]